MKIAFFLLIFVIISIVAWPSEAQDEKSPPKEKEAQSGDAKEGSGNSDSGSSNGGYVHKEKEGDKRSF